MANNDVNVVVYKILKYLYECKLNDAPFSYHRSTVAILGILVHHRD